MSVYGYVFYAVIGLVGCVSLVSGVVFFKTECLYQHKPEMKQRRKQRQKGRLNALILIAGGVYIIFMAGWNLLC